MRVDSAGNAHWHGACKVGGHRTRPGGMFRGDISARPVFGASFRRVGEALVPSGSLTLRPGSSGKRPPGGCPKRLAGSEALC